MSALPRAWRPFVFSSAFLSIALVIAAFVYSGVFSHLPSKDPWLFTAALPAFWLEGVCYLAAALEGPRRAFAALTSRFLQGLLLWISTLLPYLLFSLLAGTFHGGAFGLLLALTAVLSFWYVAVPRRRVSDVAFLVVAAAPVVARVFRRIYLSPDPHLGLDILGHIMWLRAGILALLVLRAWNPGAFGLWPSGREWKAGVVWYALAILPIAFLALAIHDVHFAPSQKPPLELTGIAIGTFFGILWVVALGEELLFRGVIARALMDGTRSPVLAVMVSAFLFGCAHLWYHAYPNWRRALVATLMGLFCGALYLRSGSVRAPMVTHALVVVTWRLLFTA